MRRVLQTSAFRLALVFTALFTVAAAVLLTAAYLYTARQTMADTDALILGEARDFERAYRMEGRDGLYFETMGRIHRAGPGLYYLVPRDGRGGYGNLPDIPPMEADAGGWYDFTYDEGRAHAHGRVFKTNSGHKVFIGRNIDAERRMLDGLRRSFLLSLGLMPMIGIAGGALAGRRMLRRVEASSAAAREIMTGDLSRRLPRTGAGDELDRLSMTLNAMLDRIERLMAGMREVSDNIAHDLRTPLTRLRARAEAALGGGDTDDALGEIIEEADGLLGVFEALMSIAQLDSGVPEGRFEVIDLSATIEDTAELYTPAAEDAGFTLTTAIETGIRAPADAGLLARGVANLIENALKYGADEQGGGMIHVALGRDGDHAEISVSDSGPGVPPEQRDAAFERFMRLDPSRNAPGAGLGLSLVRAIASAHGGAARLEAGRQGRGLRAVIRLPCA